ncbi:flagellar biosynthesis protein FlhF [Rubripirellula amarantea]|nr:flagellar biosynthesis protein FlhF [Rubripirellula amarantea]
MQIKSFRAKTMQQALELVRREFGNEASVVHTREIRRSLIGRVLAGRQVEVVATMGDRLSRSEPAIDVSRPASTIRAAHEDLDYRAQYRANMGADLADQLGSLQSKVEQLCTSRPEVRTSEMPSGVFEAYTDLIEADVEEATARKLIDQLASEQDRHDGSSTSERLYQLVVGQVATTGPIKLSEGTRRLVALVGPTGVGKTTTIAKLAANYRLREKKRVGLITVDTYRVAAVEQLRTYADIIDLPMEVVATPREMREAVARMTELDLVLLDTAGRSPRDEVQIQELKSMLGEARADEVHLVLSSTAAAKSIVKTAEQFAKVGATSLLLTKLDEAMSLGHLLTLFRQCPLPVSYLTNGQNVPDDIAVAAAGSLTDMMLGTAAAY